MSEHDDLNKTLQKSVENPMPSIYPTKKPKEVSVMLTARGVYPENWSDISDEKFMSSYVHWTSSDGRVFVPAAPTVQILTPGVYEIDMSQNIGIFFEKIPVRSEGLLRFPDTNSDKVVAEIQNFWNREDIFKEYGLTYKRGILLYGPPGSGKSCTIQLIMEDVVSRNGIVLKFSDPTLFIDGMRIFRQIQPDAPVVVIMEDIDSTLEEFSETEILNILDGVNEVNKVVFLATTNYPERLGARIVNRPSRFDKRFRIGYPSALSRKIYFEHIIAHDNPDRLAEKISELNIDLDRWVADTDGMSIAHLKELFVQVVILGDTYDESIQTLRTMTEAIEDKDYESSIGFGKKEKSEDYYD